MFRLSRDTVRWRAPIYERGVSRIVGRRPDATSQAFLYADAGHFDDEETRDDCCVSPLCPNSEKMVSVLAILTSDPHVFEPT